MLTKITSPAILINETIVRQNLQRMAAKAARHKLEFRPHGKTHQHPEIAALTRSYGVEEITVTSLRMAFAFMEANHWPRVTIAMPLNPREIPQLKLLAAKFKAATDLTVFLADPRIAEQLSKAFEEPLSFYVEIDLGYGRSGIYWQDTAAIEQTIVAAGQHRFRGFYTHAGHTYDVVGTKAITEIHEQMLERIAVVNDHFGLPAGFAYGDTPSCSTQNDFTGIHAIGPGNFVYYDLVQTTVGACQTSDIAVCLAAPVLQVKGDGREAIIHGGWVQLGKDRLPDGTYGRLVPLNEDGSWDAAQIIGEVRKLSQEHGTICLNTAKQIRAGDLVGILPVHACALVNGIRGTGAGQYFVQRHEG